MDQNILKYFAIVIATVALFGCEKEFTLDADALEPQLSIHGFMYTQDSSRVIVEATDSILQEEIYFEPQMLRLQRALVIIKSSTGAVDTLKFNETSQVYMGRPRVAGEQLQLKVSHPNYKTATSVCNVLEAPIINTKTRIDSTSEWADEYTINAELSQVAGKRYFLFGVRQYNVLFRRDDGEPYDTIAGYTPSIESYDPRFYALTDPFSMGSTEPNYMDYPVVFEKSAAAASVSTEFTFYGQQTYHGVKVEEYYEFTVSELSEEAYRYITTVKSERWTNGNPFASPVSIRDNIENGLGIFMSINSRVTNLNHEQP